MHPINRLLSRFDLRLQRVQSQLGTKKDRDLFESLKAACGTRTKLVWTGWTFEKPGHKTYGAGKHNLQRHFLEARYVADRLRAVDGYRGKKILDIASHVEWVFGLASAGLDITMADVRDHEAKRWFPFKFVNSDVCTLPFDDAQFDIVTFFQLLHYVGNNYGQDFDPDADKVGIRQIARVLKPGGHAIGATFCKAGQTIIAYGHNRVYGYDDLHELVSEAGLEFVDEKLYSFRTLEQIERSQLTTELDAEDFPFLQQYLEGISPGDLACFTLRKPGGPAA